MSEEKFTKGPWRWEVNKKHKSVVLCGGIPTFDSDVLRFDRFGMQGAQPTFCDNSLGLQGVKASDLAVSASGREHHSEWFMLLKHPDAQLIEAAPSLYYALKRTTEELAFVIDRYNKKVKYPAHFIDAETCHLNQIELAKARGEL